VKLIPLFLISIGIGCAPLNADVYTIIGINDTFTQSQPNKLERQWLYINADFFTLNYSESNDSTDSVVFYKPDGGTLTETFSSQDASSMFVFFDESYQSRSQILSGDYVLHCTGGSLDGLDQICAVNMRLMPRANPKLTPRSYRALSSTPVSRPIRLVFPRFVCPKGAVSAAVYLSLSNEDGSVAVLSSEMDPQTGAVVIPANTLAPGATYTFNLYFVVNGQISTSYGSPYRTVTYSAMNYFRFVTSSTVNLAPNDLAAEPDEPILPLESGDDL
jgi:hypothetical protein